MVDSLKTYLQERLLLDLPGEIAHREVAPYRNVSFHPKERLNARDSGVLVLFYAKNDQLYTVLMQRPDYDGKHGGQISFPGGKRELEDRSILDTALREMEEEMGVVQKDIEVVGQMTDVYIPVSNFNVSPVVGTLDYVPSFYPDSREVEEVIELRIQDLLNRRNLKTNKVRLNNNVVIETPTFVFDQKIVWGATALILNELRYLMYEWPKGASGSNLIY